MRTSLPEQDVRWNFGAAVIDAAGWGVGMSMVSSTTILPLFVRQLTPSPQAVGLIQAVMLFGWLVPGILVSGHIDRLRRVKMSVLWIAVVERLALLGMAGLCFAIPNQRQTVLWGFFGCWLVMNCAMGANMPGYYKLIAKTIPASKRGSLYGIGGAISGLLGIGSAQLGGYILERWEYPNGFAACFLLAFFFQSLTVFPLGMMREPAVEPPASSAVRPRTRALAVLRADPRLMALVIAVTCFGFNQMIAGFFTTYGMERFGATPADVAMYNAVSNGARAVAFLLAGAVADRWGNRSALLLGSAAGICSGSLAWLSPSPVALPIVFAFQELAAQAWGVCAMNYVLELCPPSRSATYTAVFGLFSGPSRAGLPLVAGEIVRLAGYPPIFAIGAVGAVVALLTVLLRVSEPRHKPPQTVEL